MISMDKKVKKELILLSYSMDPDPSSQGEVNRFFQLMELVSTIILTLRGNWLPQTK